MRNFKKIISVLLVLVMCMVAFAGCGSSSDNGSSDTAKGSDDAFKIGGTGPLTGAAAIYGTAAKNGATIAVE